jgi:predicted SAM-dependent methyltransferase
MLGNPKDLKILDIGGKNGLLRMFPGFSPTIIDIEDSDEPNFVKGSALSMPFKDGQFDYSISCDVLEHIVHADREKFVNEMLRVSSKGIIICAPFNSKTNEFLETEMNDYYYQLTGSQHRWLREHIDNGLPSEQEVESQLQKQKINFVKFRHFSAVCWREIVEQHLLHSSFSDNKSLEESVYRTYENYYKNMCNIDFSEDGYRTFFWISKVSKPEVELLKNVTVNEAKEKFLVENNDTLLNLLENEMKNLRVIQNKAQEVVGSLRILKQENMTLAAELREIKLSKSWRSIQKIRLARSKMNSITSLGKKD